MEFLKKHYEKVALAIVSLLLITTAVLLMGKVALGGGAETPDIKKNLAPVQSQATNDIPQVAFALSAPPQWSGQGPGPFLPEQWSFDGTNLFPTPKHAKEQTVTVDVLDELDWYVNFKTFPMLFMGETIPGTYQINVNKARDTKFLKVGGSFRQFISGGWEEFTVLKFEKKGKKAFNRSTGSETVVDVSELTLKRKGEEKSIVLVRQQLKMEKAPVTFYVVRGTNDRSREFKESDQFNYQGKRFKLFDIHIQRLLIDDLDSGARREVRPKGILGQ